MKRLPCVLVLVLVLLAATSCDSRSAISPSPRAPVPSPDPYSCLPSEAGGTVPPAIAVCSVTYIVNGVEQIVRNGETLQASRGEEVSVGEVAICVGPFSGDGGQSCIDFFPLDDDGHEIASERIGTHQQKVNPGCQSVAGPDGVWLVGESWHSISAVLNHWPLDRTEDSACADGLCERDDLVRVFLQ